MLSPVVLHVWESRCMCLIVVDNVSMYRYATQHVHVHVYRESYTTGPGVESNVVGMYSEVG